MSAATVFAVSLGSYAASHQVADSGAVTAPTVAIPLGQGKEALIDSADLPLLSGHTWRAHSLPGEIWYARGYVHGSHHSGGRSQYVYMHTLLTGWPRVDHQDRNGLNNTRANLRPATRSQNGANQAKRTKKSSRFKGVHLCGEARWEATINPGRVRVRLGRFSSEEQAARAYDAGAVLYFGEFAATNALLGLLPPAQEAATPQSSAPVGKRWRRTEYTSRFRGVSFASSKGKWRVALRIAGRHRHLGYFTAEEDAARAYDSAVVREFGEGADTNVSLGLLPVLSEGGAANE